jgi:hypothetical protein
MHVSAGDKLYLYSAVFAPIMLKTEVLHIWQRYDDVIGSGGRNPRCALPSPAGARAAIAAYSIKSAPRARPLAREHRNAGRSSDRPRAVLVAAANGAVKNVEQICADAFTPSVCAAAPHPEIGGVFPRRFDRRASACGT